MKKRNSNNETNEVTLFFCAMSISLNLIGPISYNLFSGWQFIIASLGLGVVPVAFGILGLNSLYRLKKRNIELENKIDQWAKQSIQYQHKKEKTIDENNLSTNYIINKECRTVYISEDRTKFLQKLLQKHYKCYKEDPATIDLTIDALNQSDLLAMKSLVTNLISKYPNNKVFKNIASKIDNEITRVDSRGF